MYDIFKKAGFDRKDTDVFLKLLELGAQPVSIVAKACSMPRSSTYLILERLVAYGFVEQFQRVGMKYFKCISVDEIPAVLNRKIERIQTNIVEFESNLDELKRVENRLTVTPKVKIFEGFDQLDRVYEDVLREKEFFAIFNPALLAKYKIKYLSKVADEVKKNKSKAFELLVDSHEAKEYKKKYLRPVVLSFLKQTYYGPLHKKVYEILKA